MDCSEREVLSFIATTGGITGKIVRLENDVPKGV